MDPPADGLRTPTNTLATDLLALALGHDTVTEDLVGLIERQCFNLLNMVLSERSCNRIRMTCLKDH